MPKNKYKKFIISWDKNFEKKTYSTRYTPTINKQDLYRGYYLSATISETGDYTIEAMPNGMHGHLYPKKLIEKGVTKNLSQAKKKVRSIFLKLTDVYD